MELTQSMSVDRGTNAATRPNAARSVGRTPPSIMKRTVRPLPPEGAALAALCASFTWSRKGEKLSRRAALWGRTVPQSIEHVFRFPRRKLWRTQKRS
jgi:hypothetical protein